jgi:phosphoribosylformylglycinamidine synthase
MPTALPPPIQFANTGRTIILLGGLGSPSEEEFGGTEYAKVILNDLWGKPPALDMDYEKRVQATIRESVRAGYIESAHDLSEGGIGVALAECSFGDSGIGADVQLDSDLQPELLLFHEGPSRVLVSTAVPDQIVAIAKKNRIEAITIGVTLESRLLVRNRSGILIDVRVDELKKLWQTGLLNLFHHPVLV